MESTAAGIASTILGHKLPAMKLTRIDHHGSGSLTILAGPDKSYLLKTYSSKRAEQRGNTDRIAERESANLEIVNHLQGFAKPHYYGSAQHAMLQDYISGTLLQEVIQGATAAQLSSYYTLATAALVNVHSAAQYVPDRRRLRRSFMPKRLERVLGGAIARITEVGLPAYEEKVGPVPAAWRRSLREFPIARVVRDLSVTKEYILGHGDFKPDNLIVGTDGQLWVIDWQSLSKAQPWYDLSYLLVHLPEKRKSTYVDQYVAAMQERGYLDKLKPSRVAKLFQSGRMYQELIRARSNAFFVRDRPDTPHHTNEFMSALTALSAVMS